MKLRVVASFAVAGIGCLLLAGAVGLLVAVGSGISKAVALIQIGTLCAAGGTLLLYRLRIRNRHETQRAIAIGGAEQRLDRKDALLLVSLALIAAMPRLWAMRHSLWWDELWTTRFMMHGPIYAVTHQAQYNNHLLNSLLGSLVLELTRWTLLGGRLPDDGSWYLLTRLPALLFGIGSVPLLYLAARPYFERPVAFVASLLLALSPAAVDLSAQTRGYSALIFCTIGLSIAFVGVLSERNQRTWLIWMAWAVVGLCSHLYMIFPLLVDGICLLIVVRREWVSGDRAEARGLVEQGVTMFVISALITIACYAPMLGVFRAELKSEAGMKPLLLAHNLLLPTLQSWAGVTHGAALLVYYMVCALLLIAGGRFLFRNAPGPAIYTSLLLIVPPTICDILRPYYLYMRFFAFALPAFLIWIAAGLWQTARLINTLLNLIRPSSAPQVERITGFWLLTVGYFLLTLSGIEQTLLLPKTDYQQAAAYLQRAQRAGDWVVEVGPGCRALGWYGVQADEAKSITELETEVRLHGKALVIESNLLPQKEISLRDYLHRHGGRPVAVIPGRYPDWPMRDFDGDSDFSLYRLSVSDLH